MTSHATTLLLVLALIIVLARALGAGARALGQPPVIGEVLAGVFVLPLLIDTGLADGLFPTAIRADLSALANIGVALFMFVVGMELDGDLLRGKGKLAAAVSTACIVLPLGLGVLLAWFLADAHAPSQRTGFFVFLAVALSITAFPVLARILTDRGMQRTPVGSLALTCAAINDVFAWVLLAVAVTLTGQGQGNQWLVLLVFPYLAIMLWVVKPVLRRLLVDRGKLTPGALAVVIAGVLLSAAATEWIGLHLIFGAFLFGVVMPRDGARELVHDKVAELNGVLLLPIFFIVAGLKVDLSAFSTAGFGELALILACAIAGKFLGAFGAARLSGMSTRHSAVLGTLMNTRGLTELIVLSIGAELGLLDAKLYTLMVVMALVTTAMAGPLLAWLYPPSAITADLVAPRRAKTPA
ncbi:cation:proton antiporter domain-containing protein [Actinokineospora diospyrosa]|uniref:Kef-type K+ transport system, membrane component KefB n=1 Tax=Actinokineospora diospyrosa TaxID=103728 RepID=A0ABT1IIU1_9PSEU|nr:cation:proton antiporter [Actinokineospora diospyrosa]MCP2272561.1 Kef-type K+ transport system, membrane component KefB [Actinokineospora diospyrosa]